MPIFAHWLDAEYLWLFGTVGGEASQDEIFRVPKTAIDEAENMLKLRALLGEEIVVSDIQLLDSPAIIRMFADTGFRGYLKRNPEFLRLVTAGTGDRFAISTEGLKRAMKPGWKSSALTTPAPTVALSEFFLTEGNIDPGRHVETLIEGPLDKWAEHPDFKIFVKGVVWGLHHFVNERESQAKTSRIKPRSFLDVLHEVANRSGLIGEDTGRLETTIQRVGEIFQVAGESGYRSLVWAALDFSKREDLAVWIDVVSAYCCAVQDTVEADGGSVRPLVNGVPIELYRNRVLDFEVLDQRTELSVPGEYYTYRKSEWSPEYLDWTQVESISADTYEQRDEYRRALEGPDPEAAANTFGRFMLALTRRIAKEQPGGPMRGFAISTAVQAISKIPAGGFVALLLKPYAYLNRWNAVIQTLHDKALKRPVVRDP